MGVKSGIRNPETGFPDRMGSPRKKGNYWLLWKLPKNKKLKKTILDLEAKVTNNTNPAMYLNWN
jgi:hypothetical protein